MSGKYLKARQLAKEMEKIAKQTAEEKKYAMDTLEKSDELIEKVKELGGEVDEAEELIAQGKKQLKENDLEGSKESMEMGMGILTEFVGVKIDELMGYVEGMHGLIVEEDRYAESLGKLERVRELISENELVDALEVATEALNMAKLEVQEKLTDEFATIESMEISLEGKEEDVKKIDEMVQEAREAMDQDDYDTAASLVDKCKDILHKDLREHVEKEIERVKKQEELVRESGVSTVNIEEYVSKAITRMEEGHFDSSLQFVKEAKGELNGAMEQIVEKKEGELEDNIKEALAIECDVREINEKRDDVASHKRKGNFSEAYSRIEDLLVKIEELKFQKVLRTIAESRDYFIKGKEIGIDISEPMGMLNKARDSLKDGDHKGALEWAQDGRKRVRELVEEHEGLEIRIAEAVKTVDDLKNINMELPEAQGLISGAREALAQKDYELTQDKLEEFLRYVDKTAYPEVMDIIEKLEIHVMTAEEMGLDVPDYIEQTEVAIANTKSGEYAKAGRIAMDTLQGLESVITDDLNKRLENLSGIVIKAQAEITGDEHKGEMDQIKKLVVQVKKAFKRSDYREAHEALQRVSEEIRKWRVGEAEEKFSELKELVGLIKSLDLGDTESYEKIIPEVEKAFNDDDFAKVVSLSEETLQKLSEELKKVSDEIFTRAKTEAVNAKKAGVDIEEFRRRLIECKMYIQNEDYAGAIKLSLKIEEDAKRITEKRKSSYELISNLSSDLIKLKNEGEVTDITPVKELLLKAKNSFQDKDYTQAESLAIQARDKIHELEARSRFEEDLRGLREDIEFATSQGVETVDIQSSMDDITHMIKEGEIDRGLEKVKEVRQEVEDRMRTHIEPKIQQTRDSLKSAMEIGVDISHPEEVLERADSALETGKFRKAFDYLEKCQEDIDAVKNLSKKAATGLKDLKERIAEAQDLHADVSEAQYYLKETVKALKDNNYEEAIEFSKKGEESVEESEMKRVYSILKVFNKKIADVRKGGVNTAFAENLLKRAEKAMDAGKYNEAINLAMQSEGEVERIELQKEIAIRSISTANKKLVEAKEEGIRVGNAEKILEQATQAYRGGFYVKAFDKAVKTGDEIKELSKLYRDALRKMESLKESVDVFKGLNIGEEDMEALVEDIDQSMQRGKYAKATKMISDAEKTMISLGDKLPPVIDSIEKTVKSFEDEGKDVGDSRELIEKARNALSIKNVREACKFAKEAKAEYGGDVMEEFEGYLEEAKNLTEMAKKFGAKTEDSMELIKEAEKLRGEDMSLARDRAREALERIETILEPYSPKVRVRVDGKAERGMWNILEGHLENSGQGVAKNPELIFTGGEMKRVDLPAMLKAGEKIDLKLEIMPQGEYSAVKARVTRIFDQKEISHECDVEVVDKKFKIIEAAGDEKCSVCDREFRKGTEVVKCSCGDTMHKECGGVKCPNCGTGLVSNKQTTKRVELKI